MAYHSPQCSLFLSASSLKFCMRACEKKSTHTCNSSCQPQSFMTGHLVQNWAWYENLQSKTRRCGQNRPPTPRTLAHWAQHADVRPTIGLTELSPHPVAPARTKSNAACRWNTSTRIPASVRCYLKEQDSSADLQGCLEWLRRVLGKSSGPGPVPWLAGCEGLEQPSCSCALCVETTPWWALSAKTRASVAHLGRK